MVRSARPFPGRRVAALDVKLVLPYPVSANRYWRSFVPKGWTRAVVHLSDDAKAYKNAVGWIAKQAGFKSPTDKPIEIGKIILVPPATRMRKAAGSDELVEVKNGTVLNLDNALKVTIDALNEIVYVDDEQIKRIRGPIEYGEPQGKGALIIEIEEFVPPAAPLFVELPATASAWP